MQSWEWRRGMRTASACENGTARCETVCSPSSNIPMRHRTTTPVSGNCGRQPPIARSRAGSAQAGAPICSLPFDQLSVPQHDVDLMRIRQFVLSWTANLLFYRVEQLRLSRIEAHAGKTSTSVIAANAEKVRRFMVDSYRRD